MELSNGEVSYVSRRYVSKMKKYWDYEVMNMKKSYYSAAWAALWVELLSAIS